MTKESALEIELAKRESDSFLDTLREDEVRIIEPDYALKKMIGEEVDLEQLFNEENLARAQKIIDNHKDSFLEWVMKDLDKLEEAYQAASQLRPGDVNIKKIARAAFVIKSQAGTFGFALATQIAKSLDDYCTKYFKPTEQDLQVVRKHIDCLFTIFRSHISGDGGAMGKEITEMLAKLVDKYK